MNEIVGARREGDIHVGIASACLFASALCTATWAATNSATMAAVALVGVLLAAAWASLVGTRPALVAGCFSIVPPGLLGENYGKVGVLALGVLWLALWSAPAEQPAVFPFVPALIGGEAVAFLVSSLTAGNAATAHVQIVVAVMYGAAALIAYELSKRPSLGRDALRAVTMLVAFTCASYALSVALGFAGTRGITLPFRTLSFSPPFTLTGGNAANYLSTPRFLVIGGEPGLGGVFLVVAIASSLILERGRRRIALLGLLAIGVVAVQSTGELIALIAMALASAFVLITRRVALLVATAVALVAIPAGLALANWLVDFKERTAPQSVIDRGLAGTDAAQGISLSALWSQSPILVIPIVALLAYLAFLSVRRPEQFGLVAALAVIAWFAQPLQYHAGVWLLLFAVLLAPLAALRERETEHRVGRRRPAPIMTAPP